MSAALVASTLIPASVALLPSMSATETLIITVNLSRLLPVQSQTSPNFRHKKTDSRSVLVPSSEGVVPVVGLEPTRF